MPQTHWNMPETFSKRCTCEQLPLSHSHSDEDEIPNRLSDINNVPLLFHFASVNGTKYNARTHQRNFGCFFICFIFFVPMYGPVIRLKYTFVHSFCRSIQAFSVIFSFLLLKSQWKGKRFWEKETPHQYAHQVHILLAMYDGHIHAVTYLWQFPVSSFYFQLLLRFAISQARCIDGALSFHEIFEGRCQQHVCVNSNQKREKTSDEYKMNVATESLRTTQCNDKIIICDRIKCQMNLIILFPVSPISFFHSFVHFFDAGESSYCAYQLFEICHFCCCRWFCCLHFELCSCDLFMAFEFKLFSLMPPHANYEYFMNGKSNFVYTKAFFWFDFEPLSKTTWHLAFPNNFVRILLFAYNFFLCAS